MSGTVKGMETSLETRIATGDHLDTPVREIMTAGVVTIVEDASLRQVMHAVVAHRCNAILVLGRDEGRPLGWVTARGLLAWAASDLGMATARDAIDEPATTVEPSASAREAIRLLSQPGVTHLLVSHRPDELPEGVVAPLDLAALAAR